MGSMNDAVPADVARAFDRACRDLDAAEMLYEESEVRSAQFESNRLKSVNTKAMRGVGLRVIHQGRIGHACTTDLSRAAELVDRAKASAQFGEEAKFAFPAACPVGEVKLFDQDVVCLAAERPIAMVGEGIRQVLGEFPDADCSGGVEWGCGRHVLRNSSGLHLEERDSLFSLGLCALRVCGESLVWADDGVSGRSLDIDVQRRADRVRRWLRLAEHEVSLGTERLPVVFTPRCLDFLLESFEANLSGKAVQKGVSLLADKVGQPIADPRVTWIDDPLVDDAEGSYRADSEGMPAERKALIEAGELKGYVLDLQTAGLLGMSPTGNGLGGSASQPSPGFANVRLAPGEVPMEQMIRQMRRGLLVDEVLGAGQSNVAAGDFSVNLALAFLVERGEIVGRIKNAMLAGNAFDAFRNLGAFSRETEWHGDAELPAALFPDLSVSGK